MMCVKPDLDSRYTPVRVSTSRVSGLLAFFLAVGTSSSAAAAEGTAQSPLADELREILGEVIGEVRYFAGSADLNGDGREETVVYVAGPSVCGTGGCDTLVLESEDNGLRLVTRISVTRPPIVAASASTNGWRDIIVHVSGGGIIPGYDARLRFDGRTYPDTPPVEPAEPIEQPARGTVLIQPFQSFTEGRLLSGGSS